MSNVSSSIPAESSDSYGYADTKVAVLIQESPDNERVKTEGHREGLLIHAKNAYNHLNEKVDIGEENVINMENLIKNPDGAEAMKRKMMMEFRRVEVAT